MNYEKDVLPQGKRDKLEIMALIVATTQKPEISYRILEELNSSYPLLTKYLKFMIEKSLIEKHRIAKPAKRTIQAYQATKKGNMLLKKYCAILRLLHGEDFIKNTSDFAEAFLNARAKYAKYHVS